MTASRSAPLPLESAYADAFPELALPWKSIRPDRPALIVFNEPLARELGLDPAVLRTDEGVRALLGNELANGAKPTAQVYAGHQFSTYSSRLGDGRALLLGELRTPKGALVDVHLKGSGPTPFSRGGDGLAALGPMLREYLVSEAMHAQGIATTRSLAVIATGRRIERDGDLVPGAVLVRVASSHLRVGTFQYARATGDTGLLARLTHYALERHAPDRASAEHPALELLDHVVERQAALLAQWMLAGFVHGVMNTDNMTVSGETIDYGPCAFLDRYDPGAVFSSIDRGGRYAFGAQPAVGGWNLTRFAESLLPIVEGEAPPKESIQAVREVLATYSARYDVAWTAGMRKKLDLTSPEISDAFVAHRAATVLADLERERGDYTLAMRAISDRNPIYIPRNLLLDEALAAATAGDLGPFSAMLEAVSLPFEERPGLEYLAAAPGRGSRRFVSYCGT